MQYLVLRPDNTITEENGDITVGSLFDILGGEFEELPSGDDLTAFALESPSASHKFNWLATNLLRANLNLSDRIVGNVVITGPGTEDGDLTGVTEDVTLRVKGMVPKE
jgi:hypothetical protein